MKIEISSGIHSGVETHLIRCGATGGVVYDSVVHVLKPSSSSYGLTLPTGLRRQYVCQDGCCDRGLQPDVAAIVEAAKLLGAKKVILRTGQRQYRLAEIAGLPVEDVSNHVGKITEGLVIDRRF